MPLQRDTLATLILRSTGDIESRLPGADARLPKSFLTVLAIVMGNAVHNLYGYIDKVAAQLFPDTADIDYLIRKASFYNISQKPPVAASFSIDITAGSNGLPIHAGTVLSRADGALFATTADVVTASLAATATVVANVAGSIGNTPAGARLTFQAPIDGVFNVATVGNSVVTIGADLETPASLAARVILRMSEPPEGGNATDLVEWAEAIPGVTRAWEYPGWMGVGTIGLTFVMDGNPISIIPSSGDVATVQSAIDILEPVPATTYVFAPTVNVIDFTIHLLGADTPDLRTAVTAQLADLITREALPDSTVILHHMNDAIDAAPGHVDHALAAPVANVVIAKGHIGRLGTVTFT